MQEGDKYYYPEFTNRKKSSNGIFPNAAPEIWDVPKGPCAAAIAVCAEIPVLPVQGTVQAPQAIAKRLLNLLQPLCG